MFPAKFHKPQSARFEFDCEPLNFLPTSPPSNLDFVFFAHMSSPSKTPRAEQGELLADVAGQSIRISRKICLLTERLPVAPALVKMTNSVSLDLCKKLGSLSRAMR
jgi:hypothetical protein